MGKITKVALNSANIKFDNSGDTSRVYEITADCEITRKNKLGSYSSGEVKVLGGECNIATFSGWNENQLNVTMDGVPEEEKDAVFKAVRLFVKELRTKASEFDLSALL